MRAALVAVGLALAGYGAVLLLEFPWRVLVNIAVWAGVGVAVHDFVFAPLCAGLGYVGRRVVPGRWWTPVVVATTVTVVLALLAIPVYSKPGAHLDNPTVLDRDYALGLLIALAVVWACVPVYYLLSRRLPVRQDQVVDEQSADDVESEPPAV